MKIKYLALVGLLSVSTFSVNSANAGDSTLDAAIGGGLGGAVGAAIGNEVGGRDGAIVGGALGGAAGAAVATEGESREKHSRTKHRYEYDESYNRHSGSRFCPPGQAKKGRC